MPTAAINGRRTGGLALKGIYAQVNRAPAF
jgi:hypothetical protein